MVGTLSEVDQNGEQSCIVNLQAFENNSLSLSPLLFLPPCASCNKIGKKNGSLLQTCDTSTSSAENILLAVSTQVGEMSSNKLFQFSHHLIKCNTGSDV